MADPFPDELNRLVGQIYDKAVEKRAQEKDMTPLPVTDHPDAPAQGERQQASRQEWSDLHNEYLRIFDLFTGFDKPDPSDSDAMIEACRAARDKMDNNDDVDVSKVKDRLRNWTSLGIDAFKDNVVEKFNEAQSRQYAILESVLGAAEANKETAKAKRTKIKKIGEDALAALNGLPSGGTERDPISLGVGIAFVAGGVVALPVTSGLAAVSTALYLVGSIGTTYNAWKGKPKPEEDDANTQVSGDSVDSVISSLETAINALRDKVVDANNKIVRTCENNVGDLRANWTQYLPSFDDAKTDTTEPDISEIDGDTKNPTEGVEPVEPSKVD